jgi:DNA-binding cell septation regulator SpoVG
LAKVTPHDVIVGGLLRSQVAHRTTFSGIFSTLPHGDIRLIFPSDMQNHVKVFSEKTHKLDKTFIYEGAWNTPQSNSDKEETEAEKAELAQVEEPISYQTLMQEYGSRNFIFDPLPLSLDDPENRFLQEYVELIVGQQGIDQVQATLFVNNKLMGKIKFSNLSNEQKIPPLRVDLKDSRNIHLVRQLVPHNVEVIHEDILQSPPPPLISSTATENISASTLKDFIHFLLDNKIVQTQKEIALKVLPKLNHGSAQAYISRFLKSGQFSDTNDNINTELMNELRTNLLEIYEQSYQQFIKQSKTKGDNMN